MRRRVRAERARANDLKAEQRSVHTKLTVPFSGLLDSHATSLMIDPIKAHYTQLHTTCGDVLSQSFAEPRAAAMAKSHAFIADLALWIGEMGARSEAPVLQAALREYQASLLALSFGQYRAAFSALRLSLELCFSAIQWSANERELREWTRGQRDTHWATLTDSDSGVLSKQFVRLFCEGLADEAAQYRASAAAVYRECSEYVHGNADTHRALPRQVSFNNSAFNAWQQKASVVRLTTSFALAARYLSDFDAAARTRLEGMVMDHLGHSAGVRALLGAPVEAVND